MIAHLPTVGFGDVAWPLDVTDPTYPPDAVSALPAAARARVASIAAVALAEHYATAVAARLGMDAGSVSVDARSGLAWAADASDDGDGATRLQTAILAVLPDRLAARTAARALVAAIADAITAAPDPTPASDDGDDATAGDNENGA
jgi:hypothetical protein